MTNGEIIKVATGATVSASGATMAWMSHLEQALRMGASAVAIVAGIVAIWSGVSQLINKRKTKK